LIDIFAGPNLTRCQFVTCLSIYTERETHFGKGDTLLQKVEIVLEVRRVLFLKQEFRELVVMVVADTLTHPQKTTLFSFSSFGLFF
jgi:hypothetical protein